KLQERILGFIVLYPQYFQNLFLDLDSFLSNNKINEIYNLIRDLYLKEKKLNDGILAEVKEEISSQENIENQHESLSYVWNVAALAVEEKIDEISDVSKEAKTCVINLKKIKLKKELKELEMKMKNEASQENIEKFDKLYKDLSNLDIE
ncbi:hypothetical protein KAK05_03620, partial [Candidatus Parcubacteria bacterium]|nr:hypothetical protein [Candidatus Parcubacteria bacterium]